MTEKRIIWKPRPFSTAAMNLDFKKPQGLEDTMYFYAGDDEDGNPIMEGVGLINFTDPFNRKEYEVTYASDYEGPRQNESQASAKLREEYLERKANEPEPTDVVEVESATEVTETEETEVVEEAPVEEEGESIAEGEDESGSNEEPEASSE